MRTPAAIGGLLAASAREHDWDAPAEGLADLARGRDLSALPLAATRHGVIGCVHHSVKGMDGVDAGVRGALDEGAGVAMARHLNALGDLVVLKPILDDAAGDWLLIKGPVLNETLYTRPDLRSYGDLDLLVPPGRFAATAEALVAAGATLLDRNWALLAGAERGQLHYQLAFGTVADLHWDLVNVDRDRLAFPTAELFERSRVVSINGIAVRTLSLEDTMLHLAVHACMSGGDRLVWLKDIERCTAAGPDWDAIVRRARAWRLARPVAVMSARAARTLDAAIPADAIAALSSTAQRWIDGATDRVSPVERSSGRLTLSRIAARAAGRGPRWALATAGRNVTARLRPRDPVVGTPLEILEPNGGDEDRRRFFEKVSGRSDATGS